MAISISRCISLALFGFFIPCGSFAQVSVPVSTEDVIVNHVDEERDRAIELIRESVNINSGTMNLEGVRAVAEHLLPEFEDLGFTSKYPARQAGPTRNEMASRNIYSELRLSVACGIMLFGVM